MFTQAYDQHFLVGGCIVIMKYLIAVIGGDARYLELIRQLKLEENISLVLVGYDKIEQSFTGVQQSDFSELEVGKLDAAILPITGVDNNGKVETIFSDQQIIIDTNWFKQLKKSAVIFTGIANDYLTKQTEQAQVNLIPLLNRDDVAIYNSIPTAEGTIMLAMENTDYTIHSSNVIVTGFGRVGYTVAHKFAALGANVAVSAKSMIDLARITEMGLTAIPLAKLTDNVSNCDLLINTIPAQVIGKETIQQLPSHTIIIDLASKPGGTDFAYAKKRGIKAILAKSLPGVVAPKTAGKILAEVIKQYVNETANS